MICIYGNLRNLQERCTINRKLEMIILDNGENGLANIMKDVYRDREIERHGDLE